MSADRAPPTDATTSPAARAAARSGAESSTPTALHGSTPGRSWGAVEIALDDVASPLGLAEWASDGAVGHSPSA